MACIVMASVVRRFSGMWRHVEPRLEGFDAVRTCHTPADADACAVEVALRRWPAAGAPVSRRLGARYPVERMWRPGPAGPAASSHAMRSHARQQQVGSEPGAVACGPSQHGRPRPGVAAEADDHAPSGPCHACGSTAHSRASCPNLDKACSLCGTVGHLRSACHRSTAAAGARPRGMEPFSPSSQLSSTAWSERTLSWPYL